MILTKLQNYAVQKYTELKAFWIEDIYYNLLVNN